MNKVAVILLAGGIGSRMQTPMPKQFLLLKSKPLVFYSLDLFLSLSIVHEIIMVCEPQYRHLLSSVADSIKFAEPGPRRQDSVYNGLQLVNKETEFVCIHDCARPLITKDIVLNVMEAAFKYGASVAGVPLKFTIKEVDSDNFVTKTPDRSTLWEIQTPQMMRTELLKRGFEIAFDQKLTVTDDVSLVEIAKHPVKIVESSYSNIKITTPDDLLLAEKLL
jgi:2-C-methyl-D-erythritol 4-phosphate cytidylyltransferase